MVPGVPASVQNYDTRAKALVREITTAKCLIHYVKDDAPVAPEVLEVLCQAVTVAPTRPSREPDQSSKRQCRDQPFG